ncbi:MAG: hypothetical protein GXY15_00240 [Candidatus Hydrogenedentes bacterium]|nr:hypothetical protein [Candidatus Hydrogenedentota bacterium]
MKLVSLQDNPQFLKGFYLRTRFPEVIFEPVLAALVLVVFLVLWVPMADVEGAWSALAAVTGAMALFVAGFVAPVAVGRMAMAEVREGTLDFYRASPLAARNHVAGLVVGAGFPEWALAGVLLLVFVPSALVARFPWHLVCAFVLSCAMTSALLMFASATVGLNTQDGKRGNGGLIAVVAVGFLVWLMVVGRLSDRADTVWAHMVGLPLLVIMANAGSLRGGGFGAGDSAVLLLLQCAMQAPLFVLCWVNLWRAFRGPRWHNSWKLQALLVAVYAFCCLIPNGTVGRPPLTPAEQQNAQRMGDLPEKPQGAGGLSASAVTMALLLGTMVAGSPGAAQVARGLRRARKAGKRGVSWLDDCAVSATAMLAVTGVCLLAQGALYAAGISRFTPQMALGFLLLCLNLLFLALFYQCVQIGWGARGRKLFMLYIIVAWVVLPAVLRFNMVGMLLAPWLPFTLLIVGSGMPLGEEVVAEATAATAAALVLNAALACAAAVVLHNQYRRLKEQVFKA